jgi:hypothetical protein
MKTIQQSISAFVSLGLLVFLGSAGCSNDNPSDPTPDLFTPTAATAKLPGPYRISALPEVPMPSKGATQYRIDVKLGDLGKDADFWKNEIVECLVSISLDGQALVSKSELLDRGGASPCRVGAEKPDDLGAFLVGTPKKTGAMVFTIQMRDLEKKVILQGSTPALPVQPDGTVDQEMVAQLIAP